MSHDARTQPVPAEIAAWVKEVLDRRGPVGAANVLGVSRGTAAAVAAGLPVMPGTVALLERAHARKQAAGANFPTCSQCGERALFSHHRQHFCRDHGRVLLEQLAGGSGIQLIGDVQ